MYSISRIKLFSRSRRTIVLALEVGLPASQAGEAGPRVEASLEDPALVVREELVWLVVWEVGPPCPRW